MDDVKRIRNTAGGDSPYTVRAAVELDERYIVEHMKSGRRWTVRGWSGDVETYPAGIPLKMLPQYAAKAVHREWAKDQLREVLPPGSTVYTVLEHVSSSGMCRHIGVRAIVDNTPRYLDGLVAAALDYRIADRGGLVVGGCGMDMGFHVVYELSYALYPDGFRCLGKKCPSNDHANDYSAFSHAYDAKHAPADVAPWWLSNESFEFDTEEQREERSAYREAKREAWEAGAQARYSRKRVHSSGAYALKQAWL